MAIRRYIRRLREAIGHDLLLLPSAAVLVWDSAGRLLLVEERERKLWKTIGGTIEPDESPTDAAVREVLEEAGVAIELAGIRGVVGGPEFRVSYPNGDQVIYVASVFDAYILSGTPRPDGEETPAVGWFAGSELAVLELTPFTPSLLGALGVAVEPRARETAAG